MPATSHLRSPASACQPIAPAGGFRLPPPGRVRLPIRRIHFEQLCLVRARERSESIIGKSGVAPVSSSAHQRGCIVVVVQSKRMTQLVGDNIACDAGPERIFSKAWDCDQDFSECRPRECEWIETCIVGKNDDHVAVRFPHAVHERRRKGLCFQRNEIAGRDRSEGADDCAEAEWAAKLRDLGFPEIDRFANRQYSEIVFGRQDDYGGDFLPHHPRDAARQRLRMRRRRKPAAMLPKPRMKVRRSIASYVRSTMGPASGRSSCAVTDPSSWSVPPAPPISPCRRG